MEKCFICNEKLRWDNELTTDEIGYEQYESTLVDYYTCPKCGSKYMVIKSPKEKDGTTNK